MSETINQYLISSLNCLREFMDSDKESILKAFSLIEEAFDNGKKILICGNGGSAADAQHFAAELIGRFKKNRKSLPAIALNTDTSSITAISNDFDFSKIFSRQIEGLGNQGDILFAISTSGKSRNVLNAATKAKEKNIKVIALTGDFNSELLKHSDVCIKATAKDTCHIQELHIIIIHILCVLIECNIIK